MLKNNYWEQALKFKCKILTYVKTILQVYGNELVLKIEDLNLLKNDDNCIQSSTAIGFCMEEFIISKLKIFTKDHDGVNDFAIQRENINTTGSSYDCYSFVGKEKFLINVKVDKGSNNAIAAINKLHTDYVKSET